MCVDWQVEVMGEGKASANSTPEPCLLNEAARRDGGNRSLMGRRRENWRALVLSALLIRVELLKMSLLGRATFHCLCKIPDKNSTDEPICMTAKVLGQTGLTFANSATINKSSLTIHYLLPNHLSTTPFSFN